ncbi:DUF6326 family protein [Tateyamaria sp. syn59]|uniref:DUF6326 family protein n=1 Tax=Tateyamaria sp. syn59 TaxID=2576942 RepID=UPI0011BD5461|nr:DUF6326 family protein [Tateyamaria sp. syn59]
MTPRPNDLRPTLAVLWLFAILNMVFRDIHEFTMASTINEILSGNVNGNPMSETVLLFGAIAVELLLLAFLLTALLPTRWSRALNLTLVPVAVAGMFFIPPADPDDYFFAAVELCAFAAIFTLAWRWNTGQRSSLLDGERHAV